MRSILLPSWRRGAKPKPERGTQHDWADSSPQSSPARLLRKPLAVLRGDYLCNLRDAARAAMSLSSAPAAASNYDFNGGSEDEGRRSATSGQQHPGSASARPEADGRFLCAFVFCPEEPEQGLCKGVLHGPRTSKFDAFAYHAALKCAVKERLGSGPGLCSELQNKHGHRAQRVACRCRAGNLCWRRTAAAPLGKSPSGLAKRRALPSMTPNLCPSPCLVILRRRDQDLGRSRNLPGSRGCAPAELGQVLAVGSAKRPATADAGAPA